MPVEPDSPAQDDELAAARAVIEHAPLTAYLLRALNDDFVLEGVNAAARQKTPALGAMVGRPISLLYGDQPQIIEDARRAHRERTRIVRETIVRRHERAFGIQQTLVFASVGREHIVIYARDSLEPSAVSVELAELQERYRSLVASLPDAVLLRGADGRVIACNDAAARLFGHATPSDLWGRTELLAPGHRVLDPGGLEVTPYSAASRRAAVEGQAVRGELYRFIAPGGKVRWVRVRPTHP